MESQRVGSKSPIHVHVAKNTPVHVHVKKKKKGHQREVPQIPTAVEVNFQFEICTNYVSDSFVCSIDIGAFGKAARACLLCVWSKL